MLTKSQALDLVASKLEQISAAENPFVVVDEVTIEKPYGWVFLYNTKKYLETGDYRYKLGGNGAAIVNKYNMTIKFFGASQSTSKAIVEYERKLS